MSDKKEIEIGGKKYEIADMDENQIKLLNQIQDLDNKIQKLQFNLVQLQGGRQFFYQELITKLVT